MRLILSLDDEIVKHMEDYCNYHNITLNELIEKLFTNYLYKPAIFIEELSEKERKDFKEFTRLLQHYMEEAITDIQLLSNSPEYFDTDKPMAEVFRILLLEHLGDLHILTNLYKTYVAVADQNKNATKNSIKKPYL